MRIASPDVLSFQVRWHPHAKHADPRRTLDAYLHRLSRDARKAKTKFSHRVDAVDGRLEYRWSGTGNGKGLVLTRASSIYFLEASSTNNRAVQASFQDIRTSFDTFDGDQEEWAAFGLHVQLRKGLVVDRHLFQSGRTRIEWHDKLGRIIAERWGFGEQLLAKHPFEEWAASALDMPKAERSKVESGWELTQSSPLRKVHALARFDRVRNQLVTIKSIGRSLKGKASWDWLI